MAEAALLPSFLPYSFGDSTVSGRAASPSKYLITCLIVGRFSGELLEHTSPSLSRITASTSSMSSSGRAFCSMGRLPHTISRSSAPKANTSELVLGFPVLVSSGARQSPFIDLPKSTKPKQLFVSEPFCGFLELPIFEPMRPYFKLPRLNHIHVLELKDYVHNNASNHYNKSYRRQGCGQNHGHMTLWGTRERGQ
nr:hypothetical protein C4D60_Mb09t08970 [Ipomoea batatas]GMD57604.1 hypothetical protein C4D60_Mb09t08970 [Ipomoea batatas]